MGQSRQGRRDAVGQRLLPPPPPPGQGHQQHQQGIALALNGEAHRIRAAESQQHSERQHTSAPRRQRHGLGHHHATAEQVGQPGQQPQAHRGVPHHLSPAPEQQVIERRMGVLTQHLQEGSEAGLKAFAHAVQLIAPQRRCIHQQQRSCRESSRDERCHQQQELSRSFHRP